MKAVILAGGFGTRIGEETAIIPKPMIEIGGKPILVHLMEIYARHGVDDFIICLGYKGNIIKDYFLNYHAYMSDITIDMKDNSVELHKCAAQPWKVTLANTGLNSMTGGRLKAVYDYVKDEEAFCFTYGDGVADIDITRLIEYHKTHGKLATITSIQMPSRFGVLQTTEDNLVTQFLEKPPGEGEEINGGFFVLSPKVIEYIEDNTTLWEQEPVMELARQGQLMRYQHNGFWHCMDTLRDKIHLETLWNEGQAPWLK